MTIDDHLHHTIAVFLLGDQKDQNETEVLLTHGPSQKK